jgi:hypothetical protein
LTRTEQGRNQGSGIRDQGWAREEESGIRNQESGIRNQESGLGKGTGIRNQDSEMQETQRLHLSEIAETALFELSPVRFVQ